MWRLSHLTMDVGYWNFFGALIWQGIGMGLIFIPLTTITNDPIPLERMGNATSIFNLMRNIGASIGISMVQAIQTRHSQMHMSTLSAHVTPTNPQAQGMMNGMKGMMMTQGADPATAQRMANGMVENIIRQQAAIMSFNDIFWLLALMFLAMLPFILLMRPPRKKGGAQMMH